MEREKHLDRLVTVSKLFMDARVAELRSENEMLRLQLFWKDHTPEKFRTFIGKAMMGANSPKCGCFRCFCISKKIPRAPGPGPCKFIPWLESTIAACGMTSGRGDSGEMEFRMDHMDGDMVYRTEVHVVFDMGIDGCSYGAKLWKVKLVDDPALQKLDKLFEVLKLAYSSPPAVCLA